MTASDPIDIASLRRRVGRHEDGELLQIRTGVLRRLLEDFDHAYPPVWLEENRAADEPLRAPETPGTYTLVSDAEGRRFVPQREAPGQEAALLDRYHRLPGDDHYNCPHSPVHDQQCRPAYDDRMDWHGRYPESPHFGCRAYPCEEIHAPGYRSPGSEELLPPYGVHNEDYVDRWEDEGGNGHYRG